MIKSRMKQLPLLALSLGWFGAIAGVDARADQSYPLYCQGPLISSPGYALGFTWAGAGAGTAVPGPGLCAWADRASRGDEGAPGTRAEVTNIKLLVRPGQFARICAFSVSPHHLYDAGHSYVDPSTITSDPGGCP